MILSLSWQYFLFRAQLIKPSRPLIISIQSSNCTVGGALPHKVIAKTILLLESLRQIVYRIDYIHTTKLSKHCDLINEAVNFQTCLPYRSRGSSVTSRLRRLTALPASPSVSLSRYKWLSLCLPYRNSFSYLGQHERKQAPLATRFSTICHAETSVIQSDCCPLHPELKLACL